MDLRLLPLLICLVASPALAKKKGAPHVFKFALAGLSAGYKESAASEATGRSLDTEDVSLTGGQVIVGFAYKRFGLDIQATNYTPKDVEYWSARNDLAVHFQYFEPRYPWLTPVFGYYQMTQTGDSTHEDAPPAFLDSYTSFSMGLHLDSTPFVFKKKHATLLVARYHYLTTFEKKRNFGNEYMAGLGYAYVRKKTMHIGGFAGIYHHYAFGELEDEDNPGTYKRVRSTIDAIALHFYFRI